MTLFMKKNSDTEVMTVLCFEYEHQLVNLWRGREADISRYRKKGQVYHYSHFEDNASSLPSTCNAS